MDLSILFKNLDFGLGRLFCFVSFISVYNVHASFGGQKRIVGPTGTGVRDFFFFSYLGLGSNAM